MEEQPIWHDLKFHTLGLWLCAICGLIAIAVSFFLIFMHMTHYSKPNEQRHIIRILFMVPIYAAVSYLSFLYYRHAVYYEVIRDCYEAFAIASFFSLLCYYCAEDLPSQKRFFNNLTPEIRNWVWPIPWVQRCTGGQQKGIFRQPRKGVTWFNVIWVGVFQYCFIRVFMTIVAVITQAFGRYCQVSLNPAFAHVWVMIIEAAAVTIAMYCIIQFYIQLRTHIAEHKPLLKVAAIKLVIFLSFWQTILISFLTGSGAIKPSPKIDTPDLKIGIPAMLLDIEMALFAFFHLWAFSFKPYTKKAQMSKMGGTSPEVRYYGGFLGLKAMIDAMNPWDMVKAIARSARWLFVRRKHRNVEISAPIDMDSSTGYKPDKAYDQGNMGYLAPQGNVGKPPNYAGSDSGDGEEDHVGLLGKAQKPGTVAPYAENGNGNDYSASDIGLAKTRYSNGNNRKVNMSTDDIERQQQAEMDRAERARLNGQLHQGLYQPPRHEYEHGQQRDRPRPSVDGWEGQQVGVASTVPYPDQSQGGGGRRDRISMPHAPLGTEGYGKI